MNPHVVIDARGVARIAGSRIKVTHVAREYTDLAMTLEQIRAAHPHLTLGQIHAALAYYYDHRAALDAQVDVDSRFAEELRANLGESPFAKRMRAEGKLP
jgi:uncharacterized protein (DUF433 family)